MAARSSKNFGTLTLRYRDGLLVAALGAAAIADGVQQIAPHPMQLGFCKALVCRLDDLLSLGQIIQALRRPAKPAAGLGKQRECKWHALLRIQ